MTCRSKDRAVDNVASTADVEIVEPSTVVGMTPGPIVFAQNQTGESQLCFGATSGLSQASQQAT